MATKRKTRKFADGGVTDDDLSAANASDDPIAALNAQKGWTGSDEAAPAKTMSFKDAFASARKAGDSTFTWNGKKYTTELAPSKSTSQASKASSAAADAENKMSRGQRSYALGPTQDKTSSFLNKVGNARAMPTPAQLDYSYKKGGVVKTKSASSRADGIAQRGKTRGKMR